MDARFVDCFRRASDGNASASRRVDVRRPARERFRLEQRAGIVLRLARIVGGRGEWG
jgi:hypothetical protein